MEDISQPPKPSAFLAHSGLVVFLLATIACFYWFKVELSYLLNELVSNNTILTYDKDIFFLFGAGVFTFPLLYLKIFNRPKPKTAKIMGRILIIITVISFIIMLVLPGFASDYLDHYMNTRGYTICNIPKVKMILYRDVTYTNTHKLCEELIKKQCEEHSWLCK